MSANYDEQDRISNDVPILTPKFIENPRFFSAIRYPVTSPLARFRFQSILIGNSGRFNNTELHWLFIQIN